MVGEEEVTFNSEYNDLPESKGAIAALNAKANFQGRPYFFDDPIDVRRALMRKGAAAGWDTPYGHTCSNIIQILEGLFDYVRPAWAEDDRQALPGLMNYQITRLERLSQTAA